MPMRQGKTTQPLAPATETLSRICRCWETWYLLITRPTVSAENRDRKRLPGECTGSPSRNTKLLMLEGVWFPRGPRISKSTCSSITSNSCSPQLEAGKRTLSRLCVPEATGNMGRKMAEACWFSGHTHVGAPSTCPTLSYLGRNNP